MRARAPDYHFIWAKTVANDAIDSHKLHWNNYHPIAYHALDVAAVAHLAIQRDWSHLCRIAERLSTKPDRLQSLTLWLVAMHDIGKASSGFQLKACELWNTEALGPIPKNPTSNQFHGDMTAWYFSHDNSSDLSGEPLCELFDRMLPWPVSSRNAVIDSIAGHHGRPVSAWGEHPPNRPVPVRHVGPGLVAAARCLAADLVELFGVEPVATNDDKPGHIAYAWWLASLLPFCDWIGSNSDYFKPDARPRPLDEYWWAAKQTATGALGALGLTPSAITVPSLETVLPKNASPSPLQEWAADGELPAAGPVMAIIEDATGSGKTEAALMLAHRMMDAGHARGFFIALPTMATADAMHRRLEPLYRRLFEEPPSLQYGAPTSLALAHGRARLMRQANQGESTGAFCSDWIAAENRRAFFAQAGAGTIDQAILAVLASKFQTLRLRGLGDKVLIVDEAHAFDAYMSVEVSALLRFHAAQGGSAILLSATLPTDKRQELADAFAQGAGWDAPVLSSVAYPLTTIVAAAGATEKGGTTRPGTEREVAVRRVPSIGEGEALALSEATRGAAVALIRTTVDEAISSYERLRQAAPDDVIVQLFHARYMYGDRQLIERDIVARFGKNSTPAQRQRRIVVATTVIEQSLDLDLDLLVSDLAPVDLLVQRAGRLWRHNRERDYCAVAAPVMHVISEDPQARQGADWLEDVLPQAVWVYRDPALLYRSANALFEAGAIVTRTLAHDDLCPAHPRRLVERVYGDGPELMEPELFGTEAEALKLAHRAIAHGSVLDPRKPYQWDGTPWADDAWVRTRLGDSVTVRLAREFEDHLLPLAEVYPDDWAFSEVRVSPRMAAALEEPTAVQRTSMTAPWRETDNALILVMEAHESDPSWFNNATSHSYDPVKGLQRLTS